MDTGSSCCSGRRGHGRLLFLCLWWLTVLSWCAAQSLDQDAFTQRDNTLLPRRRVQKFRKSQHHRQLAEDDAKNDRKRPNIVLFLTDDQDVELGELRFSS